MKQDYCKKCGKNFEKAFKKLRFIGEYPPNVDDPGNYYKCPHNKYFVNHILDGTIEVEKPNFIEDIK